MLSDEIAEFLFVLDVSIIKSKFIRILLQLIYCHLAERDLRQIFVIKFFVVSFVRIVFVRFRLRRILEVPRIGCGGGKYLLPLFGTLRASYDLEAAVLVVLLVRTISDINGDNAIQ